MDFYWVMTTENEVAKLPSIVVGLPSYVRPARPWSYAIQGVPSPPLTYKDVLKEVSKNLTFFSYSKALRCTFFGE